jgi:hypothetical protein
VKPGDLVLDGPTLAKSRSGKLLNRMNQM